MHLGGLGQGYLLIVGLVVVGLASIVLALLLDHRMTSATKAGVPPGEKHLEFHRGVAAQLGMLLIGIGVSLFVFYFQQDYQNQRRRDVEIEQVLAKLASRVGRASADLEFLPEYDDLLDRGGPYVSPEHGGSNLAVTASGADLAKQVEDIRLIERDVSLEIFGDLSFSSDLQGSPLMTEIDPNVWFTMHRDENELRYAVTQLAADYKDLVRVLGDTEPSRAVSDPTLAAKVKQEVMDILYDLDLLRDRSRRAFASACWLISHDRDFVSLHPIEKIRRSYDSHVEWIEQARHLIYPFSVGGENCFVMLNYKPADATSVRQ